MKYFNIKKYRILYITTWDRYGSGNTFCHIDQCHICRST